MSKRGSSRFLPCIVFDLVDRRSSHYPLALGLSSPTLLRFLRRQFRNRVDPLAIALSSDSEIVSSTAVAQHCTVLPCFTFLRHLFYSCTPTPRVFGKKPSRPHPSIRPLIYLHACILLNRSWTELYFSCPHSLSPRDAFFLLAYAYSPPPPPPRTLFWPTKTRRRRQTGPGSPRQPMAGGRRAQLFTNDLRRFLMKTRSLPHPHRLPHHHQCTNKNHD
ncbi:hypothetical protein B0H19DRAFT_328912 [Mycena capillaripes]|nr:hypothetical protein B0H19DRAFT_328912 [Mycena capillaripes]